VAVVSSWTPFAPNPKPFPRPTCTRRASAVARRRFRSAAFAARSARTSAAHCAARSSLARFSASRACFAVPTAAADRSCEICAVQRGGAHHRLMRRSLRCVSITDKLPRFQHHFVCYLQVPVSTGFGPGRCTSASSSELQAQKLSIRMMRSSVLAVIEYDITSWIKTLSAI